MAAIARGCMDSATDASKGKCHSAALAAGSVVGHTPAMAAGVSQMLWSLMDLAKMVEELGANRN